MSEETSLVTGANGHLGNNLLRLLLSKNIKTVASVRNLNNTVPFKNLDCSVVKADLMDKNSLIKAFKDVTNLYAVGAAFKMWAKDPQKEIYDNNVIGTQNLFDVASICGVKNIVYVSSVASLDFTKLPAKESNGYNNDRRNFYYNSKNDSDKLALKLGRQYNIRTVIILPSAMIGGNLTSKLSYSNQLAFQILNGEVPVDTNITLNWIDVKDAANGAYSAMIKGRNQERYILANEYHTSIQNSVKIASELYPGLKLKTPIKISKFLLYSIASLMEIVSKLTGKEPLLQKHYIDMFYGLQQNYNIDKAKKELDFHPKPSKDALIETFKQLKTNWK